MPEAIHARRNYDAGARLMSHAHMSNCTISRQTNAAALRTPGYSLRVLDDPGCLAERGWDDFPGLPSFMCSHWLSAFASVDQGGAGGPDCEYLQIIRDDLVVAQTLLQSLPVAKMQLGTSVNAGVAAVAFGHNAYQLGQALFSGAQGSVVLPGHDLAQLLSEVAEVMHRGGAWFLKDLPPGATTPGSDWHPIAALPEMYVEVPEAWRSFDDYLAALPSKYRTRVRRARKKLGEVSFRTISQGESRGVEFDRLYAQLMQRTAYAPFVMGDGYLERLQARLPEQVDVIGFFVQGELVGYGSLLREGGEALAHVAAVDDAYNQQHQLYLNLLLALLERGIETGCATINFGRTATTIKSSVGCVPRTYDSFVRHTGCVRNQLIGQLAARVVDPADAGALVQRPFG